MSQYIRYPNNSSILKVPTVADLPPSSADGDLAITLDTDTLYAYNTATSQWVALTAGGSSISVSDTDSIDLTLASNNISADLRLSSNAASAGNLIVPLNIESTGVVGLRAQVANSGIRALFSGTAPVSYNSSTGVLSMAAATGSVNGYLTSTDWTTFNSKQAAGNYITALTGDVTASGPGSVAATIAAGAITNAKVNATAAIAYSKLALTNSIVNADIASAAAIAYSKLNLAGSVVNADIGASAAIDYSKLALTLSIANSDISTTASISMSKLQALTGNRAVATDGSGHILPTSVTDTEQGYLSGVTSAIQTQLNTLTTNVAAKQALSTVTTKGDLYVATGSATTTRLPAGIDGYLLSADSTQSTGLKYIAAPSSAATPRILVTMSSTQSVTNGVDVLLHYDTVDGTYSNNTGWYNTGTYKYTPQQAGIYLVNAAAFAIGLTNRAAVKVFLNGADIADGHTVGGGDSGMDVTFNVAMNGTTDYLQIYTIHFSALSVTYDNTATSAFFQVTWAGNL